MGLKIRQLIGLNFGDAVLRWLQTHLNSIYYYFLED